MDDSRDTLRPDNNDLTDEEDLSIQLFRLPDGRTAEVHFVHKVPKDLVHTMALHRVTLLQSHPVHNYEQYVIVVGDGSVRGHDDPVHTGTYFNLKLLYLKDIEKEWFPISPGFALLDRSQTAPWASEILAAAGTSVEPFVIPPNPKADLFAKIDEKQAEIPATLVSLLFQGRFGVLPEAPPTAQHMGWASAVTTALALHVITQYDELRRRIGHREGIADVLGDVLRERFGEHSNIPPLAYRLAALPNLDAVIQIITTADDFDELYAKYLTN